MMPTPGARKLISAAAMAEAVAHDLQFQLPNRPEFARGTVVVPLADGLLVEGCNERQVFRGRASTTLLPRLLPLLDGTRDAAQIASVLPDVLPAAISNAIALLYTRGLLAEGATDDASRLREVPAEFAAFLQRHVDATRVNRNAEEAAVRLRSFRLLLLAEERHAALLDAELRASGCAPINVGNLRSPPPDAVDLVVAFGGGEEDRDALKQLDERCAAIGVPWLRSFWSGDSADIGPYFDRHETSCYSCFAASDATAEERLRGAATSMRERAWIALLATEIVFLVSRICAPLTVRNLIRFDFAEWSQTRMQFPPLPGCPACSRSDAFMQAQAGAAFAYEHSVRFPSRRYLNPKDHQIHYRVANLELQRDQKFYPSAPLVRLAYRTPDPDGCCLTAVLTGCSRAESPLDLATLSGLLLRAGGLRQESTVDGMMRRWAPTGGNLGSVQIYLFARDVLGLQRGCFFYQAEEHALARVNPAGTTVQFEQLFARAVSVLEPSPSAVLVLTGALHRVAMKYGSFAYRIILFDAGVAVAQIGALARGYGLLCEVAARWDDNVLIEAMALNEEADPITVVIGISGSQSRKESEPY